jgi:hypothetical protein
LYAHMSKKKKKRYRVPQIWHRIDKQNSLPIRGKQTGSSKGAHANTCPIGETYLTDTLTQSQSILKKPQPSSKQRATGFRAPLHCSSCSLSFLSNNSYFIYWLWLIIQLPHEPVLWPVKARTLDTGLQHFDTSTSQRCWLTDTTVAWRFSLVLLIQRKGCWRKISK